MTGTSCKSLKAKILNKCKADLTEKLDILVEEMNHLAKDIEEDAKSSAGDKYETNREMVNLEREKIYLQIEENRKQLALLSTLTLDKPKNIGVGSLVKTNKEWIYLAISLGKLSIEKEKVLVVSPVTPLGKEFIDKLKGDSVRFNNKTYNILAIC